VLLFAFVCYLYLGFVWGVGVGLVVFVSGGFFFDFFFFFFGIFGLGVFCFFGFGWSVGVCMVGGVLVWLFFFLLVLLCWGYDFRGLVVFGGGGVFFWIRGLDRGDLA